MDTNDIERPIAFASRTTLANEKNWSVTDLEAGGVVYGIRKFRHMLRGTPFILYTDHRALQYIETMRDKTPRAARWHEFLSAFQHTIRYREGPRNGNCDGPSRNPLPATAADLAQAAEDESADAYCITDVDVNELLTSISTTINFINTITSDTPTAARL